MLFSSPGWCVWRLCISRRLQRQEKLWLLLLRCWCCVRILQTVFSFSVYNCSQRRPQRTTWLYWSSLGWASGASGMSLVLGKTPHDAHVLEWPLFGLFPSDKPSVRTPQQSRQAGSLNTLGPGAWDLLLISSLLPLFLQERKDLFWLRLKGHGPLWQQDLEATPLPQSEQNWSFLMVFRDQMVCQNHEVGSHGWPYICNCLSLWKGQLYWTESWNVPDTWKPAHLHSAHWKRT